MMNIDEWKKEKLDAVENLKRSTAQRIAEMKEDVRLWRESLRLQGKDRVIKL